MDKEMLKNLIIKYRDEDGLTFQAIADIIRNDYGIVKDRQSIYGMYKRAKERVMRNDSKAYNPELVVSVITLSVLGHNKSKILKMLEKTHAEISYNVITNVLRDKESVDSVRKTIVYSLIDDIDIGLPMSLERDRLNYKGIRATENGFKDLVSSAYAVIINNMIANELVEAYRSCKDRAIINSIKQKLDTDVPIGEIKSRI